MYHAHHSIAVLHRAAAIAQPTTSTFAHESVMDELAARVQVDPVDYRLRHLRDARLIEVLKAAATAARWETRPSPRPSRRPNGRTECRGIACVLYEGDNGYCAMVAEVEVDQDTGTINVTRLVASGLRSDLVTRWHEESDRGRRITGDSAAWVRPSRGTRRK